MMLGGITGPKVGRFTLLRLVSEVRFVASVLRIGLTLDAELRRRYRQQSDRLDTDFEEARQAAFGGA